MKKYLIKGKESLIVQKLTVQSILRPIATFTLVTAAAISTGATGIREISLDKSYMSSGEKANAKIIFDDAVSAPADATLRVTLLGDAEVTADAKTPAGAISHQLVESALGAAVKNGEAKAEISLPGVLVGRALVKAEILVDGGKQILAMAQSPSLEIGVRKHIDLAGAWTPTDAKLLEGDVPWQEKGWKMPPLPASVQLPGVLPFGQNFRGWMTLKREISWSKEGDLLPRTFMIWGASDSALVKVNGVEIGETQPHTETAFLTHWVEYHSPPQYKGDANELKRMLLLTSGTDQPVLLNLPKPLPAEGKAEIEMTIRATSGGVMTKPIPPFGILRSMHMELTPPAAFKSVTFDTQKPGDARRFIFKLTMSNDSGKEFKGKIRTVYGRYDGEMPYTGACYPYAEALQDVTLPAGESTVEVMRDELPRFDTCRANFMLVADGRAIDIAQQDFHTVTVEIRDRRDLYLNNERFILKGQGSYARDLNGRMQLKLKGGNAFRGHEITSSPLVPGLQSEAAYIDGRLKDGLLTSAGSALLASCEKCTFWNPKDTSNIHKSVKTIMRNIAKCPGIIDWEATNELHGEPPEARVEIQKAFHAYDPYHRPVLCTKSTGEWEAEAHEGKVDGVDIVGCQYLLNKEGLDSVCAAITEQPIMSTEVNFNDPNLFNDNRMYETWMEKGVCGSLLFDYSGNGLDQPVPLMAPKDDNKEVPDYVIRESMRNLYQDLFATAEEQADGQVLVTLANRMPYTLNGVSFTVKDQGRFNVPDLKPGAAVKLILPKAICPPPRERMVIQAQYQTHKGLPHVAMLVPTVKPAPQPAAK